MAEALCPRKSPMSHPHESRIAEDAQSRPPAIARDPALGRLPGQWPWLPVIADPLAARDAGAAPRKPAFRGSDCLGSIRSSPTGTARKRCIAVNGLQAPNGSSGSRLCGNSEICTSRKHFPTRVNAHWGIAASGDIDRFAWRFRVVSPPLKTDLAFLYTSSAETPP